MSSLLDDAQPLDRVPDASLKGVLHIFVAFDWGEEIDLKRALELVPAEVHNLPRRRRTPTSITYRPRPLRFPLAPGPLELPGLGTVQTVAEVTLFDFAAVSLAWHLPFHLTASALLRLAGWLAESLPLVAAARTALEPLYRQLLPAIQNPLWKDNLSEEYFVFQLLPADCPIPAAQLLQTQADWLARVVRLESGLLSKEETSEALRLHMSYSPNDLFVPDWAAALLSDEDCDETLQVIEFANLQLLEFRHIDNRLDDSLTRAYQLVHPPTTAWLPFWRNHRRPLRRLGELEVEASDLVERTGNVLKLVGDQYLARVYRQVAGRFHLEEWEQSILRKLEVAEGVYRVVADQAAAARTEFLELIVIVLILIEILLAVFKP